MLLYLFQSEYKYLCRASLMNLQMSWHGRTVKLKKKKKVRAAYTTLACDHKRSQLKFHKGGGASPAARRDPQIPPA